jgi:hypothetical protein
MPDYYPAPTVRAWDDFSEYVPLLLAAIDAELLNPFVWHPDERTDALQLMDDLKTFIAVLADTMKQAQTVTEKDITPTTIFPLLLRTVATNETVDELLLTVDVAFDAGSLSVGDDDNPERFMSATTGALDEVGQIQLSPQHRYEAATDVKIYLTGTPTVGAARVTLYTYEVSNG